MKLVVANEYRTFEHSTKTDRGIVHLHSLRCPIANESAVATKHLHAATTGVCHENLPGVQGNAKGSSKLSVTIAVRSQLRNNFPSQLNT